MVGPGKLSSFHLIICLSFSLSAIDYKMGVVLREDRTVLWGSLSTCRLSSAATQPAIYESLSPSLSFRFQFLQFSVPSPPSLLPSFLIPTMTSSVIPTTTTAPRATPPSSSNPLFPSRLPRLTNSSLPISFARRRPKNMPNSTLTLSDRSSNLRPKALQSSTSPPPPSFSESDGLVFLRLHRLVSEFQSLLEPIDRVKRLLDYATVLPRLGGDSTRSPENRVAGCAAQVWLEVEMDEFGRRMRFGADSDSEITKGFCSCLIYLLDGASPEEVLMVKAEDLADMNVGLPVRSRVNSWNNVLINMQERTKFLMLKSAEAPPPLDPLPSLVISPGSIIAKEKDACFA